MVSNSQLLIATLGNYYLMFYYYYFKLCVSLSISIKLFIELLNGRIKTRKIQSFNAVWEY